MYFKIHPVDVSSFDLKFINPEGHITFEISKACHLNSNNCNDNHFTIYNLVRLPFEFLTHTHTLDLFARSSP